MKKYVPEKNFSRDINGILLLILLSLVGIIMVFFLEQPLQIALQFNLYALLIFSVLTLFVIYLLPYGKIYLTDNSIEKKSFIFHKKIRFDEITEIHQIEILSPYTYFGEYYVYIKSRDSKIKFCDRIQGYKDLIQDIVNSCGKDSFDYREDKLNKWWIRKRQF